MIQCPNCMSGSLSVKKFICTTEDYRIIDDDNNLLLVTETHEQPLEENEEEVNDEQEVMYCDCKYWVNGRYWLYKNVLQG
tara:strand:+ start:1844 stop:2083 length:240 start_codon:yes stop_codon:yes gene_type:complete